MLNWKYSFWSSISSRIDEKIFFDVFSLIYRHSPTTYYRAYPLFSKTLYISYYLAFTFFTHFCLLCLVSCPLSVMENFLRDFRSPDLFFFRKVVFNNESKIWNKKKFPFNLFTYFFMTAWSSFLVDVLLYIKNRFDFSL